MDWTAFFKLHSDLPREGPGTAADVRWAVRQAGTPSGARILDAGSGPGGDVQALLDEVPGGHVTAIDTHADFVEAVVSRFGGDRVDARQTSMMDIAGPFDFIWCAGAIYFHGVEACLTAWADALAPGGHVAFTEPCYFTDSPSTGARSFWGEDAGVVMSPSGITRAIEAAGYREVDGQPLSDAAWEAYHAPIEARMAALRPNADAALAKVLDMTADEIAGWRAHRKETGYWLTVVRPQAG